MAVDHMRPATPELLERIERLRNAYHPHLRGARFKVEWRDESPVIQSMLSWAEVDTPNNDADAGEYDFYLWFAEDAWALLDEHQRDALTEHELYHCGYDDKGQPHLMPHNIEEFNGILTRYGLWWPDSGETAQALTNITPQAGAGGDNIMPKGQGYQRPFAGGSSGSTGAGGSSGSTGAGGSSGSTGAGGSSGSTGAGGSSGSTGAVAYSDPALQPGGDFYTVDIGNGRVIELSPQAYQALVQSLLNDLASASV